MGSDQTALDLAPPSSVLDERTPAAIAFTAAAFGGAAPSLETGFTYLDLGCGSGVNMAVLAEVYRYGRFYGLDPDMANIEQAQALKEKFWIENTEFHHAALTDVLSVDLPKFDFVSLTGAYTQLSIESQGKIRAFLGELLKPEGAVLVRYPAFPGNMPFSLMNIWGKLLIERHEGTAREKTIAAFSTMKDALHKEDILQQALPTFHMVVEDAAQRDPGYMSLYFNSEGDGMWFHDIAEHMQAVGLAHAGSTLPQFNMMADTADDLTVTRLRKLNEQYDDPILEQELISALTLIPARADVFCKTQGTARHAASLVAVQDYYLQPIYTRDSGDLFAEVQKTTAIDLSQSIYSDCLKALDFFGDKVSYFERKCPAQYRGEDWERTILHLYALKLIQISPHPLKSIEDDTVRYAQDFTASKFVKAILKAHIDLDEQINLPAPSTGTTAELNMLERLLCLAVIEGSLEAVWPVCEAAGHHPPRLSPDSQLGYHHPDQGNGSAPRGASEKITEQGEFVRAYTPYLEYFKVQVLPNLVRRGVLSVL